MKKNKFFIALFATILCITFLAPSAWAGKKQRYRWEGAAIALGAAILGNAIYNNRDFGPSPSTHNYSPPPPRRNGHWEIRRNAIYNNRDFGPSPSTHNYSPPPPRRNGHWEIRRVRVRPSYERVWNQGHYNRRGRWIRGHRTRILKEPGHSFEKRVWVNHGYHRR